MNRSNGKRIYKTYVNKVGIQLNSDDINIILKLPNDRLCVSQLVRNARDYYISVRMDATNYFASNLHMSNLDVMTECLYGLCLNYILRKTESNSNIRDRVDAIWYFRDWNWNLETFSLRTWFELLIILTHIFQTFELVLFGEKLIREELNQYIEEVFEDVLQDETREQDVNNEAKTDEMSIDVAQKVVEGHFEINKQIDDQMGHDGQRKRWRTH